MRAIPMQIRSIVKLAIFWFLIFVLSCASGPKVKDIAVLHYGDDEEEIIQRIGKGSEIVFFRVNGVEHHFRFYSTALTAQEYSLLFTDGYLIAVSEEHHDLDSCIYTVNWDKCFSNTVKEMKEKTLFQESDFSEALSEEEIESYKGKKRTATQVAVAPLVIITLPLQALAFGCGGYEDWHPIDDLENASYMHACNSNLKDIRGQIYHLPLDADMHHIIGALHDINENVFKNEDERDDEYTLDIVGDQRSIYGKSWSCGGRDRMSLDVSFGFDNEKAVWFSKSLQPGPSKISQQKTYRIKKDIIMGMAKIGYPESQWRMYDDYGRKPEDRIWLCQSAENGYAKAQFEVGRLYWSQDHIEDNKVKAYVMYKYAATGDLLQEQLPDKKTQLWAGVYLDKATETLNQDQLLKAAQIYSHGMKGQCESDLARKLPDQ